jgi:hypothetical protein
MGYSCNAMAGMVYDAMIAQLQAASEREHDSQNVWDHKGVDHFAEIGREQSDGAVTGTVWRFLPDGQHVRRIGSFRINPGGKVSRWPTSTLAMRWAAQQAGAAEYQERFSIPFLALE